MIGCRVIGGQHSRYHWPCYPCWRTWNDGRGYTRLRYVIARVAWAFRVHVCG